MAKRAKQFGNTFNVGAIPASSAGMRNGMPPAFDMVAMAGVISIIGNMARNRRKGKNAFDGGKSWAKMVSAIIALALILGFMDKGALSQPVRAFAALGLLVAVLYYTTYIFKK